MIYSPSLDYLLLKGPKIELNYKIDDFSIMQRGRCYVELPKTHLHLKAQTKLENQSIQYLAHGSTSQILTISTNNNTIINFNEDLTLNNKINLKYTITDLLYDDSNSNSIVYSCTCEGSVHIWNTNYNDIYSFRSDSNFRCEDVPQLISLSPKKSILITSRGNSGIFVWDTLQLKLIKEYPITDKSIISALSVHPENENVVITGYQDGTLMAIDIRDSNEKKVISLSLGEKIIKIAGNRTDSDLIYTSTIGGRCFVWDSTKGALNTCGPRRPSLNGFEVHEMFPIMMFSPKEDYPFLTTTDGNQIHIIKNSEFGVKLSMHKVLPIFSLGSSNGLINSYQLLFS